LKTIRLLAQLGASAYPCRMCRRILTLALLAVGLNVSACSDDDGDGGDGGGLADAREGGALPDTGAADADAPRELDAGGDADGPPVCVPKNGSCTNGKMCCGSLACCSGVPVVAGQEFCSDACPMARVVPGSLPSGER
jgi:hypothetical protein